MQYLVGSFAPDPVELSNASLADPDPWLWQAFGATASQTGIHVTGLKALGHIPLWQAVNILSGDVGLLPLQQKRREGRNTEIVQGLPASKVLANPSGDLQPSMCPSVFRETIMEHALVRGNGLASIGRNGTGQPMDMTPLPTNAHPEYDEAGRLWIVGFVYVGEKRKEFKLDPRNTFHIRGLSTNGFWGHDLVRVLRDAIGHGLALDKHTNTTFRNQATPKGALEVPHKLEQTTVERLRREWAEIHEGLDNTARIAILQQGTKFATTSMTSEDAQMIESHQYNRQLIASLFDIPAILLNDPTAATLNNVENLIKWYLARGLMKWLNRWTEECRRKLLSRQQFESYEANGKETWYFDFDVSVLLRADMATRFTSYNQAIASKIINPNEAREKEGLNPYEGGDEFENPNTSTSSSGEDDRGQDDQDVDEQTPIEDAVRRLFANECQRIARHEAEQVKKGAKTAEDFTDWVEDFYGREFRERLDSMMGPEKSAEYCNGRRIELLGASRGVGGQGLASLIEQDCQEYREHGRQLVNLQFNGQYT